MESEQSTWPAQPDGGPVAGLAAGARIGRYVVLGRLGIGGMGVVFTAFDPELDRKLAIKLLLPDGRDAEQGRRRLLREAQALARLRHPNVVSVHDVGVHGDAIFVAMDLVPGVSLRAWLREHGGRRDWREVVPAFAQIAHGLAAAHAAGLVHRDFKPDNAIIDPSGRVCVLDFGLVTRAGDAADLGTTHADSADALPFDERLTRPGALVGTPGYMAPEQLMGHPLDGRCDQYALCVAMFEALTGDRPFQGTTAIALLEAITRGPPEFVGAARVPAWLRAIVRRGLAVDPEGRFGSMTEIATALSRAPRQRRRILVATAIGSTLAGSAWAMAGHDVCADAEQQLRDAWSIDRRTATIAAMTTLDRPYGAATAHRVTTQLDAYAHAWSAAYEDACRAAHDRGEQSSALHDRRMACLDTRRRALDAFAGLLLHVDAALLERAVEASSRLPAVTDCADLERLLAVDAPPVDPEARAAHDAMQDRLAAATAAELAGHYADGVIEAEAAATTARDFHLTAAGAEAELVRGRVLEGAGRRADAEAALRAAVYSAALADHARVQAEAELELVYVVGFRGSRFDEGKGWADAVRGLVDRLADPALQARLDNHLGVLLHASGAFDDAVVHLERALERRIQALGADHLDVAESHFNLALALRRRGDLDGARTHHDRALAIRIEALGPEHPRVAESHAALGILAFSGGDTERATVELQRAAAIQRAALGPGHPKLADTLTSLGNVEAQRGDLGAAEASQREALAILESSVGDDAQTDRARHNLAVVLMQRRDHVGARDLFARVALDRARRLGPTHPDLGRTLTQLGRARLETGQLALARADLERASTILASGTDALATARARIGLALALHAAALDADRARTLATEARSAFVDAGASGAAGLEEADRLLAAMRAAEPTHRSPP